MKGYIICVISFHVLVSIFPSCEESEPIQKEIPKTTLNKKPQKSLRPIKHLALNYSGKCVTSEKKTTS